MIVATMKRSEQLNDEVGHYWMIREMIILISLLDINLCNFRYLFDEYLYQGYDIECNLL